MRKALTKSKMSTPYWVALYVGLVISFILFSLVYKESLVKERKFASEQVSKLEDEVFDYFSDIKKLHISYKPHIKNNIFNQHSPLYRIREHHPNEQKRIDQILFIKKNNRNKLTILDQDSIADLSAYQDALLSEIHHMIDLKEEYKIIGKKKTSLPAFVVLIDEISFNAENKDYVNDDYYLILISSLYQLPNYLIRNFDKTISAHFSIISADGDEDVMVSAIISPDTYTALFKNKYHFIHRLTLLEEEYHLHFDDITVYESLISLLAPYFVLIASLSSTLLVAAYMYIQHQRELEIQSLAFSLEETNSELKKRMKERDQISKALRQSEKKYREMYENAVEGTYQASFDGKLISANLSMSKILGYETIEEFMDKVFLFDTDIYVDSKQRKDFLNKLNKKGTVVGFEAQVKKKSGETIWISETARKVSSAAQNLIYVEGKIEDISGRKEIEKNLTLAKEQAEIANRTKTEFLGSMSHELRTPLNAIIGFSEIIKEQIFGKIAQKQYVEYSKDIYDSGKLLLDLINDILDVSRLETNRKSLSESKVDIASVFNSCTRLLLPKAQKKSIHLHYEVDEDFPLLWAEELSLKQILANLITNALKFTPEKGRVNIRASLSKKGEPVLSVEDTGVGMTRKQIQIALTPFGQIQNKFSENNEGVGLGLPIIVSLVELHHGVLDITSKVDQGSIFKIILPKERIIVRNEKRKSA